MKEVIILLSYGIIGLGIFFGIFKSLARMKISSYTEEFLSTGLRAHAVINFKNRLGQSKTRNFLIEAKEGLAGDSAVSIIDTDTGENINFSEPSLYTAIRKESAKFLTKRQAQNVLEEHYDNAIDDDEKSWDERFAEATSAPKYRVAKPEIELDTEAEYATIDAQTEKETNANQSAKVRN